MKTTNFLIAAEATTVTIVLVVAAYTIYYAAKYGPGAATPAESWVRARINRRKLDRELDRIMKDSEVR